MVMVTVVETSPNAVGLEDAKARRGKAKARRVNLKHEPCLACAYDSPALAEDKCERGDLNPHGFYPTGS